MRYKNVSDENFDKDSINCGIGGDKTQNILWRSKNTSLQQSLKYVVITQVCGTNNLDTDNPDETSDGLVWIALFLQKRIKHLQIVVNELIPRDAINTKQRQKLLELNQLLQEKCTNYISVYFLKPDTDWKTLSSGLNKTCYFNIYLLENGIKKLILSFKTKLDNISVNFHEITINEKEIPTIKAVDRPVYRRAITTSSRNRQLNSIVKRNIKMQSQKCQLNFKTLTKILANQTQIQTKTQPETTSNITSKTYNTNKKQGQHQEKYKKERQKARKTYKPPIANPPKKKLATKFPLTKKQQTTLCLKTDTFTYNTSTQR